jgi:hypothetical protein
LHSQDTLYMLPLHVLLRLPSWIFSSNFWAGRCQRAYGTETLGLDQYGWSRYCDQGRIWPFSRSCASPGLDCGCLVCLTTSFVHWFICCCQLNDMNWIGAICCYLFITYVCFSCVINRAMFVCTARMIAVQWQTMFVCTESSRICIILSFIYSLGCDYFFCCCLFVHNSLLLLLSVRFSKLYTWFEKFEDRM